MLPHACHRTLEGHAPGRALRAAAAAAAAQSYAPLSPRHAVAPSQQQRMHAPFTGMRLEEQARAADAVPTTSQRTRRTSTAPSRVGTPADSEAPTPLHPPRRRSRSGRSSAASPAPAPAPRPHPWVDAGNSSSSSNEGADAAPTLASAAGADDPSPSSRTDWRLNELLTAWTLKAQDLQELRHLYSQNRPRLNTANLVAMLTQLSWLYAAKTPVHATTRQRVLAFAGELVDRLLQQLQREAVQRSQPVAQQAGLIASIGYASVAHAAAPASGEGRALAERIQALSALGRLGYSDKARVDALLCRLLEVLPDFAEPRHFAEAAWAIAKLGHDPGQLWIAELLDASRSKLHLLNLAELGNMIWALAKWGYRPGTVWMTLFFRRCTYVLGQQGGDGEQAANGAQPSGVDEDSTSTSSTSNPGAQSARIAPAASAKGGKALALERGAVAPGSADAVGSLTSLTWGLAMLRAKPPPELARRLLAASDALLPHMGPQALAGIAWALCRLDVTPPTPWLERYLSHTLRALPAFQLGISFSNVAWALANWRAAPGDAWLREFVRAATPLLGAPASRMAGPDELSTLLQALADLGARPSRDWASAALESLHRQHTDASAPAIATSLWALSRMLQTCAESAPRPSSPTTPGRDRGGSTPQRVFFGPGKAWVRFYRPLMTDLLDVVAAGLAELTAPQLVDVLVALADLGVHPGEEWLELHERCCNAAIAQFTAYQINLLYNAMDIIEDLEQPPPRQGAPLRWGGEAAVDGSMDSEGEWEGNGLRPSSAGSSTREDEGLVDGDEAEEDGSDGGGGAGPGAGHALPRQGRKKKRASAARAAAAAALAPVAVAGSSRTAAPAEAAAADAADTAVAAAGTAMSLPITDAAAAAAPRLSSPSPSPHPPGAAAVGAPAVVPRLMGSPPGASETLNAGSCSAEVLQTAGHSAWEQGPRPLSQPMVESLPFSPPPCAPWLPGTLAGHTQQLQRQLEQGQSSAVGGSQVGPGLEKEVCAAQVKGQQPQQQQQQQQGQQAASVSSLLAVPATEQGLHGSTCEAPSPGQGAPDLAAWGGHRSLGCAEGPEGAGGHSSSMNGLHQGARDGALDQQQLIGALGHDSGPSSRATAGGLPAGGKHGGDSGVRRTPFRGARRLAARALLAQRPLAVFAGPAAVSELDVDVQALGAGAGDGGWPQPQDVTWEAFDSGMRVGWDLMIPLPPPPTREGDSLQFAF